MITRKFHLAFASALILFAAGCTTTGTSPETTPSETTETRQNTSTPPKPAVHWENLQEKLRQALQSTPGAEVSIDQTNGGLHLLIPVGLGFASGKAEIRPSLTPVLNAIATTLSNEPKVAIHIIGHTDSIGNEMYNQKLSILRAEAVMEYLHNHGIAFERLSADGKGEAEPIADNAKESGRARNRRVEFFLQLVDTQP